MAEEGGGGDGKGKGGLAYRPVSGASRACCCGLLAFVFLAGLTALILYLVYRPSKPRFTVIGAAVYELNATSQVPTAISTSMQFTVAIRNPNERSSLILDRLTAYAVYRDQPITPPAPLPPLYQDEDSTVAVSPVLGGPFVPVSPEVAGGLVTDQAYGALGLRLVVMGRIKYKAGPFRSAWTRIFVRCDLLVGLKKGTYGQVPILGATQCSVSS
ncbi:hypothetical protein Taro_055716 [Colocasia esculenta]|uniref:Late embryogenesis abundant protein LEA-2 subgroup domain-containing protein n=1 Tax=Colocasia esculenta TaxID=4460 RepID=A0A843XUG4_COLES|nr:hypothetical protein [Colocasia esculenta]